MDWFLWGMLAGTLLTTARWYFLLRKPLTPESVLRAINEIGYCSILELYTYLQRTYRFVSIARIHQVINLLEEDSLVASVMRPSSSERNGHTRRYVEITPYGRAEL